MRWNDWPSSTNGSVTRSTGWIGGGAVAVITLFGVLGSGIAFVTTRLNRAV